MTFRSRSVKLSQQNLEIKSGRRWMGKNLLKVLPAFSGGKNKGVQVLLKGSIY